MIGENYLPQISQVALEHYVTCVQRHFVEICTSLFFSQSLIWWLPPLVQVGILPWLFLTSRVSKLLCQKFGFVLVRP
jgi:hypothetical protein